MTKQEQIEEIKRVLISVYGRIRTISEDCINNRQAEALENAGYRKVLLDTEDGKVVDCVQYAPWQLIEGYTEREVKKARKETAKEIMQCLYDKCYEIQNLRECVAHITPLDILQLAKHYGVEVEE